MPPFERNITVGLNPAIDRVIEVPSFQIGGHLHGRVLTRTPAGKAVNVAKALARLGVSSTVTGFVGRESVAAFDQALADLSILTRFIPVDAQTRENITLIDPSGAPDTHIRDVGFAVTKAELSRMQGAIRDLAGADALLIFSGSLPGGVTAADFRSLVSTAVKRESAVAVDTSGEALAAMANMPLWMLKPNREELAQLAGRPIRDQADVIAEGRRLSRHVQHVLISCGAEGACLFRGESGWTGHVTLAEQRVVNTVGCGDCMLAAYVAALYRRDDIDEALRCSLAVATASALSAGPSEFDSEAVERLRQATTIQEISTPKQ